MEKWEVAQRMVDNGKTNAVIVAALKTQFGSGISTTKLADWRETSMDRLALRQKEGRAQARAEKHEFVVDGLRQGHSFYSIQQGCRAAFGSSVGYSTITKIAAAMSGQSTDIVPVEIPAEVLEDPVVEEEETALTMTAPPPNGSLTDIKSVQSWMKKINAKSLTLTEGGDLSVLVEHNFNLGDAE